MRNILEIDSITKKYFLAKNPALTNVSFSIKQGCILGFIGPNGAGKTTTINIISRILKKDSGRMLFEGKEIKSRDYLYKIHIGFVLERPMYFEKFTAREYLEFVGGMYELKREEAVERTEELITLFDLQEQKNDWIVKYSAGMKKKVSLAAAIIHNPKLLILDEPFENVDPVSRKRMKDIIKKMKMNGTAVLIASHALSEVEEFCDEVAIINKGKILLQSSTEDIRKKIKNKVTQDTYNSLEEIFLDLTGHDSDSETNLTWL